MNGPFQSKDWGQKNVVKLSKKNTIVSLTYFTSFEHKLKKDFFICFRNYLKFDFVRILNINMNIRVYMRKVKLTHEVLRDEPHYNQPLKVLIV